MEKIKFQKWQGLGNDFIILEEMTATKELAIKMCDRKFGIGADGLFSAKKPIKPTSLGIFTTLTAQCPKCAETA